jgi:pyruvate kinase
MPALKKTKIVCTIGPASDSETVMRKMILAGMHVARLNFSHGSPEERIRRIALVRKLNRKYRRHVLIIGDLEGPRIRIGRLKEGKPLELKKGRSVILTQKDVIGQEGLVPFDYAGSLKGVAKGRRVYIDDGNIALDVVAVSGRELETKVVVGGTLKQSKGVNIPGAKLEFGPISRKDVEDICFSAGHGLDYVAQSFVRSAADVTDVRKVLQDCGSGMGVISKIENEDGINNIEEIIGASDGIMVARGDMGVSVPIYKIPIIQKVIIRDCMKAGKFVITATQMLESMTEHRTPTRAEVTDVANAVMDGTDYVMLSAESAAGKYPAESVEMMQQIVRFTEDYLAGRVRI